ncbi:ectonucleoside triphosphate diphosphohydrolase 2-like [Falco biarmicus]|uniref:ectonucleoside triphosphate diphosphohydrolase 2-like n=1 Tax=Falco cherrug TaxID=345164 RepID=UPI000392F1B5|nr:ectonucleoside triphosphate diphosphohydrolase 2-like [Falco cherrug]XP_037256775.1 ectonucleoside triphosphate diphosphohydrolase 2-like [Falco rusticolus]XP_055577117.1 ectonucleoside triphosphate diphosphohydrolase 2-like [Falco cherrug]XP_056208527.1 ectonucleoside triphosphate diphosphohydrolase 2-like [Falco biarmicus]XP_056208528.1 ectonucleoside triphosphate diphosphohydrolase 2-like [Falco biarmicus]
MSWRELLPPWLVIVAGLTGIVLLCISTKDVPVAPLRTKYGIVLDAGPSRTILFLYQWTTTKANKTGVIRECSSCPVQGLGVSSYSDSPQKVGKSLEPCLNWAQKEIPAEQHSQTPLYLGATASMRQLNLTNPILSDGLLAALTVALKSSPFDFKGAQILSSPAEEAFSWVAVNYVLENFFKYDWRGQLVPSTKGMAGVLSVGGTSTQFTSKVEEENQAPKEGVRLQLYGQTHNVYTHHCPCHSTDQLRSRLLSMLIQDQRSAKIVSNPCWPLTYSREVQWRSVHTVPCAASDHTSDIPAPEEVFNITGSSNPTACMRLVQSLLNSSSSCSFFKSSLSSVFKPLRTRFLVISEAMDFMRETVPSPDLGQAVNRLCGMSVKELVKDSHTNLDRVANYCIVSAFILHLSTKGYTFDFDRPAWTAFQKKMGDASSSWTLGYLLSLTNTIPQDSPSFLKGIEPGVWSLLLILFVVLLTGSFMRISYRVMVKENSFSNRNSSVFDDN